MNEFVRSIIWRRLDTPGHEWAQVAVEQAESRLYGTSIFVHDEKASCLEYLIECDADGETEKAEVVGEVGEDIIDRDLGR